MDVIVINLTSAIERRQFQEEQLSGLGLDYEVLDAISTNDISEDIYKKHYYDWQRPLRKVEVACYYSHRSAWQKVIDNNKPVLILEDDALLSKHSKELLYALEEFSGADFIQLEIRNRKKLISKKNVQITSKYKLYRLYLDRTGAAGYVLWPSGAKKLVEYENINGIGLADAHITACYDLIGYQVEPAVIIQLDQCTNYQIKQPICSNSQILAQPKPAYKYKLFFKYKRIISQLDMAIRQVNFFFRANRREILLNKKDFINN